MRIPPLEKTHMLKPTPGERLTGSPAVVLLLFLLVMTVAETGKNLLPLLVIQAFGAASPQVAVLTSLFATVATVGAVLLYCLAAEKRGIATLGLSPRGGVLDYGIGLLTGGLMLGGSLLICVAFGYMTLSSAGQPQSWGLMLLYFAGFLLQGMSEELLCRSYLMVSLSRGLPISWCAVVNALLFSFLHLGNLGISPIALLNIFLFGLFASLLTLRRGSIWMVAALHSTWNFAQGNLFGIPVSGITGLPTLFRAEGAQGTWPTLLHGGSFGLEGGVAVTAVLLAATAVALLLPTKKSAVLSAPTPQERMLSFDESEVLPS